MYNFANMNISRGVGKVSFVVALAVCAFFALPAVAESSGTIKILEYIESSSDRLPYIDTGYVPNANTEIEFEFAFPQSIKKVNVFGVYDSSYKGRFQFGYGQDSCSFGYGATWLNAITGFPYDTERHVIKYVRNEGFYFDGTLAANTTTWEGTSTNLCLGGCNGNGTVNQANNALLQIYSCKIWNNGVLVRNFIPVLDGEEIPCLYDIVGGKFYKNAGGGSYVAGKVVKEVSLSSYKAAVYIESSSDRLPYIDTGYVPNANTEIEFEFAFPQSIKKVNVFGVYDSSYKGRFQFGYGQDSCSFGYGATWLNAITGFPYDTERHVIKYVRNEGFYFDGTLAANTTTWEGTSMNLCLGGCNGKGTVNQENNALLRIYSCKIWNNGELVRDLVPKQRKLDGKNGLYDNVNGKFYAYYGSPGNFSKEGDFTASFPAGISIIVR